MGELLGLFLNNILPIFLSAGAGYVLGRRLQLKPRFLSQIVFFIFSPCLLFNLLTKNQLSGRDVLTVFMFEGLVVAGVFLVAWGLGRLLRLERRTLAGVLLISILMNAGNFGMPLTDFAFGSQALAYAVVYFVGMSILTNTAGIIIASMGSLTFTQALKNLLKFPGLYALALALLFTNQNWSLPSPISRTVELLGNATIPCMLVVMGMQFQSARWDGQLKPLSLALSMRMLLAPALAFVVNLWLGLQGPAHQATILESAMPPAVFSTILATEFDTEPSFVTFGVFIGTLLSPLTLTPLLSYLGA